MLSSTSGSSKNQEDACGFIHLLGKCFSVSVDVFAVDTKIIVSGTDTFEYTFCTRSFVDTMKRLPLHHFIQK